MELNVWFLQAKCFSFDRPSELGDFFKDLESLSSKCWYASKNSDSTSNEFDSQYMHVAECMDKLIRNMTLKELYTDFLVTNRKGTLLWQYLRE